VIARRDGAAEPFELIPRREALGRCDKADGLDPHQQSWCASASADVAALKAKREALDKQLETIAKPGDRR
jgi:hypothetical protein